MSSSDEPFGWSAFRERTASMDVELRSPASELAAVLQRHQQDLDAERDMTRRAVAAGIAVAAEQAVLVSQLGAVLKRGEEALATAGMTTMHRQLRIVQEQMADALGATDLVVVDPLGKPFDETAEMVDVVGWRHGAEYPGEVVAETIEPIVLHNGAVVRHGRVIMGAPQNNGETA
jgi:molecular chaperone GrpE (heat shock protein)